MGCALAAGYAGDPQANVRNTMSISRCTPNSAHQPTPPVAGKSDIEVVFVVVSRLLLINSCHCQSPSPPKDITAIAMNGAPFAYSDAASSERLAKPRQLWVRGARGRRDSRVFFFPVRASPNRRGRVRSAGNRGRWSSEPTTCYIFRLAESPESVAVAGRDPE